MGDVCMGRVNIVLMVLFELDVSDMVVLFGLFVVGVWFECTIVFMVVDVLLLGKYIVVVYVMFVVVGVELVE